MVESAAAGCRIGASVAGVGSKDGAASACSVASHAAVSYSRTFRCGGLRVATTVILASTNLEPSALWVPQRP